MSIKEHSSFEYILISVANAAGLDKLPFQERIDWVCLNGKNLRAMAHQAEDYNLFIRGVMEIERCVLSADYTSGFRVGLDACASGVQCLSVLCACITSASRVGLVDPDKRCDVYTALMGFMNEFLPADRQIGSNGSEFTRNDHLKPAFMTHFYGSKMKPLEVFGKDTQEYHAFYDALDVMTPGVQKLYKEMFQAMDEDCTEYSWTLPDGAEIVTPVMLTVDKRVKVDELGSSFTHRTKVNEADDKYCALLANLTHSVDGWLIREVTDRVNYNGRHIIKCIEAINNGTKVRKQKYTAHLERMIRIAERSKFVSARFFSMFNAYNINMCPEWIKQELVRMGTDILSSPRSPVSSVHDQFDVLPSACNGLRKHYNEVLACIAESQTMQFIFQELYGDETRLYHKESDGKLLAKYIRSANYSLS